MTEADLIKFFVAAATLRGCDQVSIHLARRRYGVTELHPRGRDAAAPTGWYASREPAAALCIGYRINGPPGPHLYRGVERFCLSYRHGHTALGNELWLPRKQWSDEPGLTLYCPRVNLIA